MPCAEPGSIEALTPPGKFQLLLEFAGVWSLLEILISQNSPCRSFTFLLGVGVAVPRSVSALRVAQMSGLELLYHPLFELQQSS